MATETLTPRPPSDTLAGMTDGPFRTPSRPPVEPHPSWGTVRAFSVASFVVGFALMGALISYSGQWRRVDECVEAPPPPPPPPEPPPFCETACETIGYRAIRSIRDEDSHGRRSPTCVCGNEQTVVTLYADGGVLRWSVGP